MTLRLISCSFLGLTLAFTGAFAQGGSRMQTMPAVTPRPADVKLQDGTFNLHPNAFAHVPMAGRDLYLSALSAAAGFELRVAPADAPCAIQFLSAEMIPTEMKKPAGEGYVLRVTPQTILIYAGAPEGHFNGLQTLAQLLRGSAGGPAGRTVRCMTIEDQPRFAWRGFMLDESRHFSGKAAVLRLLDAMSVYKLNRFHWHLTDSPGWRIEIKAFPKLTEVGARGSETDRRPDAAAHFYTQDDIREIVAYARMRNIAIIPEIDMPGHADAAVLAYPELDGGGFTRLQGNSWARFTFNPGKAETLKFLDTVLNEMAGLFPDAGVIHFGGDEVHFGWEKWSKLPEVQKLMQEEKLKDNAAVEAWFNRRMARSINQLGFKTGGWDEIAARGLPTTNTVVFWWRHDKPEVLRNALAAGYPVVLCPRRPCYFDFVQHDSHKAGRRWGGYNPIEDVYAFPAGLSLSSAEETRVLGLQGCLWTETMITQARRDFMTWPRLIALAESGWTPDNRKDIADFKARLPAELERIKSLGLDCYDPAANSPEATDQQAGKPKGHLD